MHLTNRKVIVLWLSVVSLALPAGAGAPDALAFDASCVPLSAAVATCYALLAGVFGYAGVRILMSSQAR